MEHFVKNLVTDRFLHFSSKNSIEFGKWQKKTERKLYYSVPGEKFTQYE